MPDPARRCGIFSGPPGRHRPRPCVGSRRRAGGRADAGVWKGDERGAAYDQVRLPEGSHAVLGRHPGRQTSLFRGRGQDGVVAALR